MHDELVGFGETELLEGLDLDATRFWAGLAALVDEMGPRNRAMLDRRSELQAQLDAWHRAHPGAHHSDDYHDHLREIGYVVPEAEPFTIETASVDPEIATIAGPQLVVPVMNARYALNAANARWGSLYDALYGTAVLPEAAGATRTVEGPPRYHPVRRAKVIGHARHVADRTLPLRQGYLR